MESVETKQEESEEKEKPQEKPEEKRKYDKSYWRFYNYDDDILHTPPELPPGNSQPVNKKNDIKPYDNEDETDSQQVTTTPAIST